MTTSFRNKKRLRFIITLGTGTFGSNGDNRIVIEGLRASVNIEKAGGVQMGTLRAKIYGVRDSDMQAITTLQWQMLNTIRNSVEVVAIDGTAETLVFAGTIVNAWGDFQSIPDVFLHLHAQVVYFDQIVPSAPLSYKGAMDAAQALRQIAEEMGLQFENNGATAQLNDIYVANTLVEKAKDIAAAANFDLYFDDNTLAITPRGGARDGIIPPISAATGLVGYPTFDGVGVSFVCLFNPAIVFGGLVRLDTDIPQARGVWKAGSLSYRLECEKPGGAWFTTVRGSQNGIAVYR